MTELGKGQLEKARGIADGFRDAWHPPPLGRRMLRPGKAMEIDSGTIAGLQTGLRSLGRPLMSHEPGGWSQLVA